MRPKVFISQWMPAVGVKMLSEYCDVDYYAGTSPLAKEELISRAKTADAMVMFVCDTIDQDIIKECKNLRVISSFGKGYDNIDVQACTQHDILVTINPDSLTESTADFAMGLVLAAARNILPGDRYVREGMFTGWHPTNLLGRDFHHSRFGIVGFGVIGQAIAKRAKSFAVEMTYYDQHRYPFMEEKLGIKYVNDLDKLLAQNDFIMLVVNYTRDSHQMINKAALEKFKTGSVLVNICRGSVVDEQAVAEALESGKLRGYAADVFSFEDRLAPERPQYINSGLLSQAGNTVLTPHIGTGTIEARELLAISTAKQLLAALSGRRPSGAVNDVLLTKMNYLEMN